MKKFGFTLAEVLITLGIIGVVAALATPALITAAGNAKTGPSLAKAVSTFTTATEMMLAQEEVSSIVPSICNEPRNAPIWTTLSKYMKGTKFEKVSMKYSGYKSGSYSPISIGGDEIIFGGIKDGAYTSEDGFIYYTHFLIGKQAPHEDYANIPSNQLIGDVYIDINGQAKPNKIGKDLFKFYLYNDGSLKPYGSTDFDKRKASSEIEKYLWNSNDNCNENGVNNAETCAGSVFENNLKVIYQ